MTNDLNPALCPAQHHAHTGRLLLVTLLWLTASAGAQACNIPVFRYALERWNADEVEIVVFMDQRLTKEQSDYIEKLQQQSVTAGGPVNCRVAPVMVRDDETDSEQTLWHSLRQAGETVKLPFVVARSRSGRGRIMNHWKASLDQTIAQGPCRIPLHAPKLLIGCCEVMLSSGWCCGRIPVQRRRMQPTAAQKY